MEPLPYRMKTIGRRGRAIVFTVVSLVSMAAPATAQEYSGEPCRTGEQTGLRAFIDEARGEGQGSWQLAKADPGSFSRWATSILPPPGDRQQPKGGSHRAYDEWTCTYAPYRAVDDDPETAWCEAAEGAGVGELMLAHIRPEEALLVRPGFAKSEELFHANNRPKKLRISVISASFRGVTQIGSGYELRDIVADFSATLADENRLQRIAIPDGVAAKLPEKADPPRRGDTVLFTAVEIRSVYHGEKWDDTCVAEVTADSGTAE